MREIFPNVVMFDDQRILTPNLAPGVRVYDEELHTVAGVEHRTWNPSKSKLGAFIMKGGQNMPLRANSRVLYLGAANGTTPSHVSDIVANGTLIAVEFSPRSFRDLLNCAASRPNMMPVLADAWRPELYEKFVGKVDFLFQDIAQRQQAAIFAKNLARFKPEWAMLAIKARSVDVAKDPRDVYREVCQELEATTAYEVVELVDLGPYERDHAAVVLKPGKGSGKFGGDQRGERREERRDDRPQRSGGFQQRDDRPRGGGGGFQRRDDRPAGGGGGFQRRDDRGGGGGGGFQKRSFDRSDSPPPSERNERRVDRRGDRR